MASAVMGPSGTKLVGGGEEDTVVSVALNITLRWELRKGGFVLAVGLDTADLYLLSSSVIKYICYRYNLSSFSLIKVS